MVWPGLHKGTGGACQGSRAAQREAYGGGRRQPAIARVFLRPGTGEWKVNGKAFEEYFVTAQQRVAAKHTLVVAELASSFDVVTTVKRGGVCAQADAVKMGIARALIEFNPELRKTLKAEGLLTRDARMKERKDRKST